MGAVPARCWKELAGTSHPMPLIHSPTHCRLHTNTPQRPSELMPTVARGGPSCACFVSITQTCCAARGNTSCMCRYTAYKKSVFY